MLGLCRNNVNLVNIYPRIVPHNEMHSHKRTWRAYVHKIGETLNLSKYFAQAFSFTTSALSPDIDFSMYYRPTWSGDRYDQIMACFSMDSYTSGWRGWGQNTGEIWRQPYERLHLKRARYPLHEMEPRETNSNLVRLRLCPLNLNLDRGYEVKTEFPGIIIFFLVLFFFLVLWQSRDRTAKS